MSFSPETNNTHREMLYADNGAMEIDVQDSKSVGVPEHDPYRVASETAAAILLAHEAGESESDDSLKYDIWEATRVHREVVLLGRTALCQLADQ